MRPREPCRRFSKRKSLQGRGIAPFGGYSGGKNPCDDTNGCLSPAAVNFLYSKRKLCVCAQIESERIKMAESLNTEFGQISYIKNAARTAFFFVCGYIGLRAIASSRRVRRGGVRLRGASPQAQARRANAANAPRRTICRPPPRRLPMLLLPSFGASFSENRRPSQNIVNKFYFRKISRFYARRCEKIFSCAAAGTRLPC